QPSPLWQVPPSRRTKEAGNPTCYRRDARAPSAAPSTAGPGNGCDDEQNGVRMGAIGSPATAEERPDMPPEGSVTHGLTLLQAGAPAAAQPLWEAYCRRLAAVARARLRHAPRQAENEEDAALSACASFCRRAERGDFPQLLDRHDLWQVL